MVMSASTRPVRMPTMISGKAAGNTMRVRRAGVPRAATPATATSGGLGLTVAQMRSRYGEFDWTPLRYSTRAAPRNGGQPRDNRAESLICAKLSGTVTDASGAVVPGGLRSHS